MFGGKDGVVFRLLFFICTKAAVRNKLMELVLDIQYCHTSAHILCTHFEMVYFTSAHLQQLNFVVNESYRTVEEVTRNLDGENIKQIIEEQV